jgi:hypothetical protein
MADLLEQLEQEFGLREVQTESLDLYGHKWTLRKLDYDDVDKANQFIFRRSPDEDDTDPMDGVEPLVLGFRSSLAFVAVSLSAIDDNPVCFVFKTATPEEIVPFSPLTPPTKIRHRTAERVHRFFSSSRKNMETVMQLYDLYTEKLDDRSLGRRKPGKDEKGDAEKTGETSAEGVAAAAPASGSGAASASPLTESGPSPTVSAD